MVDSGKRLQEKCAERKKKNPVGRPKGGNLVTKAFNDAMERGDLDKALDTLVQVGKDPDHKHWAAAQKMMLDRIAHVSNYEKGGGKEKPQITINIGSTDTPVTIEGIITSRTLEVIGSAIA